MKRHLTWGLACLALCVGAASAPARAAQTVSYPQGSAEMRTADGVLVGSARVQLDLSRGAFLSGGKSYAARYAYHMEFDTAPNVVGFVTGFEPSGCGIEYSLASNAPWTASTWEDFNSRLMSWEVENPEDGAPGGTTTTFTGYSNAMPAVGRITVRGFAHLNGSDTWQACVAELSNVVTMGCDEFDPPAQPSMTLAIASNKNPIGLGETLTTTITVNNTGTTDLDDVVVTQDAIANTTYVPNSTIMNKALVPDVNGQSELNGGMHVSLPAGGTATISCSLTVDNGARGSTLECTAHADVEGFESLSATASVAVIDSVESALAALKDLIQEAKDAGAFRGRLVRDPFNPGTAAHPNFIFKIFEAGQPKMARLLDAIDKALAAGNRACAVAFLDRIASDALFAPGRRPATVDANGNVVPLFDHVLLAFFNDDDASQAFGPEIAAAANAVKTLILAEGPATGSTSDCSAKFVAIPK
jgi:uncharacterized repeat protein (TIGR01451 family)